MGMNLRLGHIMILPQKKFVALDWFTAKRENENLSEFFLKLE